MMRLIWLSAPMFYAEPLKSGKRRSLSRSRRKSHECGLAAIGFRLKGEL
jgi:hypothetical protein